MTRYYNKDVVRKLGKEGRAPQLILRVTPETLSALKFLAEKDRRSLSEYVRLLLEDHIAAKRKRK